MADPGGNVLSTGNETAEASNAGQKRPTPDEASPQKRVRRGKYTAVVCDPCKKRKLKCAPKNEEGACPRCAASGLVCDYTSSSSQALQEKGSRNPDIRTLSNELRQLVHQVKNLAEDVNQIRTRLDYVENTSPQSRTGPSESRHAGSPGMVRRRPSDVPKQPQFIGPTRSAYSFEIGERSLTQMGIPSFELPPISGPQSAAATPVDTTDLRGDFWHRCNAPEVARLIEVFKEEIEPVYPCIDCAALIASASQILEYGRSGDGDPGNGIADCGHGVPVFGPKDFALAKVVIATAVVIEAGGNNDDSNMLVESVEQEALRICRVEADLKDIQLLAILSIYYFHSDEDLLAWRAIGVAAREALEMGLHRRASLMSAFENQELRCLAIRVFWCVYVLDRRWSFGTSLSFALNDKDMDPELPEPGAEFPYLQCMVGYGRLCSKLWDALMAFGSASSSIPEETAASLDYTTQEWLESIPSHLQLRHPRLGLGSRTQPRVLHRLRALLYLRGNYTRTLIYRHHLLSPGRIKANMRSAWLVVEIAQDSVQVLVHLNATSDIYSRQQSAFNYFLVSALAVIFLAVCHEPTVFAEPCRKSFHDAVKLVRDFSRNSKISRRLWHSIRGLLPRLRRLGMRGAEEQPRPTEPGDTQQVTAQGAPGRVVGGGGPSYSNHEAPGYAERVNPDANIGLPITADNGFDSSADQSGLTPNMFQMSNDLMALFDVFEQGQQLPMDFGQELYPGVGGIDAMTGEGGEVSRRFQGLI